MLTDYEFKKWCSDQKLPKSSISTLTDIRSSEPARRVGGGRKNVSGFYPSKKNQKSIQFESHKVELPFIYELEHDESVLEYYDQPPAFKINYQSKSGRNLGFFYTPDFFVIRVSSAGWVECKTEKELQNVLTKRTDLHFLTLRPWEKVLSKRDLLRHERVWCAFCYQEWRDTNKSIYEPLIWCINVVQICPIHHHPFLSVCPHCLNQQLVLSGDSQTGHCNKCGKWLGSYRYKNGGVNKMKKADEIAWQLYVNQELGELIASAPTIISPIDSNRISQTISTFINQAFQSNQAALSRAILVNQATIGSWCKGKVIPQIDKLLLLSHQMKIKLLDFLTTDILFFDNIVCGSSTNQAEQPKKSYTRITSERKQVLNIILQEVINEYPPPSLEDVAFRLKHYPLCLQNHFPELCQIIKVRHADYKSVSRQQKIQPILELALQEFPPPSFLEISRRLGYKNNSYLYRYFPELSRSISKRYQEYNNAIGKEKRELVCQEIQNVAQLLHSQGQKPTQGRVTQLLTKPGVMRNLWVRSYLREIQQSLGYD